MYRNVAAEGIGMPQEKVGVRTIATEEEDRDDRDGIARSLTTSANVVIGDIGRWNGPAPYWVRSGGVAAGNGVVADVAGGDRHGLAVVLDRPQKLGGIGTLRFSVVFFFFEASCTPGGVFGDPESDAAPGSVLLDGGNTTMNLTGVRGAFTLY